MSIFPPDPEVITEQKRDALHQAERLIRSINVLAVIANTAAHVGAPIRSMGAVPGSISSAVETEDGLRSLASQLGLPDPKLVTSHLLETQGDFAGVGVSLHCYVGGDQ